MWTRTHLRTMFEYPFITCGVKRLSAVQRADNEKAPDMNEVLGFTIEGITRRYFDDTPGGDAIRLGMLPEECKWINLEKRDG